MPYSQDIGRFLLNGTSGATEVWTTTFHVRWTTDIFWSQATLDSLTASIKGLFDTAWTTLKTFATGDMKFTECRGYVYEIGSSVADWVSLSSVATPQVGTSSIAHPLQCGIVQSLRSSAPTRSGRGRMYLPLNGIPMSVNGNYNSTNVTSIATTMKTFYQGVNAIAVGAATTKLVVASATQSQVRDVLTVVTDTRPDVQRRRANKVIPSLASIQTL